MQLTIEELGGRKASPIETFILQPTQKLERLGNILVLADFSDLPETYRYLGAFIAGTVKRHYFAPDASTSNPQYIFTRALKATNDALAEETKSSTGQWIGALRAIVGVVADQTAIFSSAGGCAVFLRRKETVTEMPLDPGEGSRPFGSFTTGSLEAGDELLVAPRTILGLCDVPTELMQDPKRLFAKLRRKEGFSCLRLAISHSETAMHRTLAHHIFASARVLAPLHSLRVFSQLPMRFARFASLSWKRDERESKQAKTLPRPPRLVQDDSRTRPDPKLHLPLFALLASLSRSLPSSLRNPAKRNESGPFPRRIALGLFLLGGIIIGAVVYGPTLHRNNNEDTTAATLSMARAALERGETEAILGNTAAAIAAFTDGLTALAATGANNETEILRAELLTRRNAIADIQAANVEEILTFEGFPLSLDAGYIALTGGKDAATIVALAGEKYAALWLNRALNATGGTFLFLPPPFTSGIRDLAVSSQQSYMVTATDEGFAVIHSEDQRVYGTLTTQEGKSASLLAGDGATLFAVSPKTTSISALTIANDGNITEQPWLRAKDTALQEARDATILKGEPLVLLSPTTFVRYRNGKRLALYTIEGHGWEGEARAFTALPQDRLAVLDTANGRVLITNASGDIQKQFEHERFKNALNLVLSPNDSSLLILTQDALLRLTL